MEELLTLLNQMDENQKTEVLEILRNRESIPNRIQYGKYTKLLYIPDSLTVAAKTQHGTFYNYPETL